ncbi:MAG: hypothetical protein J6Y60_03540 [Treponema sp.]|nr:hypothetical protein [Treponema sp.]
MANLETLELTISANAESAVKSIDKLATHLVALGQVIQKPLQQLTALAKQLQTISKANVSNVVNGVRTAGGNRPGNRNIAAGGTPLSQAEALAMLNSSQTDLLTQKSRAMAKAYVENAMAGNLNNQQLAEGALRVKAVTNQIEKLNQTENEVSESTGKFKDIWQAITKSFAGAIVIGSVMKSIKKGFQEAWQGAYKFSKSIGGDFAKGIDTIKGSLQGVAISLVQTLAPAINVIAPIINMLANVIKFLSDAIQELLTWMGITSEMFGNTMDKISGFAGASKKAAKESSSAFDELNVIGSNSGGGGGSASTSGLFSDSITAELAKIQLAVGEAMIAVGLILAFSGQVGLGVGMIAIGAAAIVKTYTADWGSLTDDVRGELATITAIAGASMLAVGLILALTGAKVGLGIGLMVAGVANLATAVTVSWGLSKEIKSTIADIMTAVSGGLLAIGAVLAFTGANLPLGIGLMVAGAASLAASVALQWGLDTTIKDRIQTLAMFVGGALLALGAVIAFTGASLPIGIGMMVAGAAGLVAAATINDKLKSDVANTITTISGILGGALLVIGAILCFTGAGIPLGLGMMAAGGISLAAAIAPNWDSISGKLKTVFDPVVKWLTTAWDNVKKAISNAWTAVKTWWTTSGLGTKVSNAWKSVKTFFTNLWVGSDGKGGIRGFATKAWDKAKTWWTTNVTANVKKNGVWGGVKGFFEGVFNGIKSVIGKAWDKWMSWTGIKWSTIQKKWNDVKSGLQTVWNSVKTSVTNAWNKVKEWWTTSGLKTKVTNAWSGARQYLYNAWDSIKTGATNAWNKVKEWWTTSGIGTKITNAWSSARQYLYNAWDSIKTGVTNAWNKATEWWTTSGIGTKITNAWSGARKYLYDAWISVKDSVSNAWNKVVAWWTTSGIGTKVTNAWSSARQYLYNAWDSVKSSATTAWDKVKEWWTTNVTEKVKQNGAWGGVVGFFKGIIGDSETGLIGEFNALYAEASQLWGNIVGKVESAWKSVSTWFYNNVTMPIGNFFIRMINGLIDGVNWLIGKINSINITVPKFSLPLIGTIWNETKIGISGIQLWGRLDELHPISTNANGAYGIPRGDLFIANEQGAELVGSIGGKTSVANQQQIVDGIADGVRAANNEQNTLLRRQNELLLAILQKTGNGLSPSSALGRVVNQSLQMYGTMTGG